MNQMKHGWIKLDRKLLEWELINEPNTVLVWIVLLLKANIEPTMYKGVLIDRGSLHTTQSELEFITGLKRQPIRTALSHLKLTNSITIQKRREFSIISILNYDAYQGKQPTKQPKEQPKEQPKGQPSLYNKKKHSKECQRNTLLECKEEEGRQKSDKTDSASSSEEIPNWTPEGRYMPIIRWVEDSDE